MTLKLLVNDVIQLFPYIVSKTRKNVKLVLTLEFVPTFKIISFMAKSKLICLAPFQTFLFYDNDEVNED